MVSVMMDKIHSPFCGNNAFLGSREALTRAFSEGKGVIFSVTVFLAENTVYFLVDRETGNVALK